MNYYWELEFADGVKISKGNQPIGFDPQDPPISFGPVAFVRWKSNSSDKVLECAIPQDTKPVCHKLCSMNPNSGVSTLLAYRVGYSFSGIRHLWAMDESFVIHEVIE